MNKVLGWLTSEQRELLSPVLKHISTHWPDWLEWTNTLETRNQKKLTELIIQDPQNFLRDTMWDFQEYIQFRERKDQKDRRIMQESIDSREDLQILNAHLVKKYGFDLSQKEVSKI